ncbi:hypothetical protein HNQ36_003046 [Afipia massiliensis]|uniref:Uncharacterized protein n=1 Tax=Afipia massiliensis TaxID=211460 RepID=A0A840MYX2_9BRAD|nr:hypothetical protein [Afipia massiliensis]MBB5053055.1 hypothetical protein [Afipia massiliensis]
MKAIPTLEERHPRLRTLLEDQNGIFTRIKEKTAEKIEISERIRDNPSPGNGEINRLKRLLNQPTDPDVKPDRERLPELVSDIESLKLASAVIDDAIQQERRVASRLICEDVSGEHTVHVKDFAAKIVALHAAHERYVKFLDAVESTGASLSPLQPVSPYTLGHPASVNGTYYWSMREFLDNGHITKRELPKAFQ